MKVADESTVRACKEHAGRFIEALLSRMGAENLDAAPNIWEQSACALTPIVIDDYRRLTDTNRTAIAEAYNSVHGVAYFIVRNPGASPENPHPIFDIAQQLRGVIPIIHPLPHPMEGHLEAVSRFGPNDGTVKIYNLPGKGGVAGYREQAETDEIFDFHHDGLGSGGTVETVILYMDRPPLFGGFTCFVNIAAISLHLARCDREAFESLFLPDAITIIRPRGKGSIKVVTPVLFMNEAEMPQSFFRVASGEYVVNWGDYEPLVRARKFLHGFVPPFSRGSSFVHLTATGHGCLNNNQLIAHARTAFQDDPDRGMTRVLSRKWFMRSERDAVYKHVPGMFLSHRLGTEYAQISAPSALVGEWNYDPDRDINFRLEQQIPASPSPAT